MRIIRESGTDCPHFRVDVLEVILKQAVRVDWGVVFVGHGTRVLSVHRA
jgi:hypothetical protein